LLPAEIPSFIDDWAAKWWIPLTSVEKPAVVGNRIQEKK